MPAEAGHCQWRVFILAAHDLGPHAHEHDTGEFINGASEHAHRRNKQAIFRAHQLQRKCKQPYAQTLTEPTHIIRQRRPGPAGDDDWNSRYHMVNQLRARP